MEGPVLVLTGANFVLLILALVFLAKMGRRQAGEDGFVKLNSLEEGQKRLAEDYGREARFLREEVLRESRQNREEMAKELRFANENMQNRLARLSEGQQSQLERLIKSNEEKLERLRITVDEKLSHIEARNEKKLEEMRVTVDEKLSQTLNRRLGESFHLVSERLEQVNRGLGEMRGLSTNLTDIKRIFANVKTRGVWGEVQLAAILEQLLTPDQYEANVATAPRSNEKVEFALKLPGRDGAGSSVYLPIDAKFPSEDYQRLLVAEENGDAAALEAARRGLLQQLKKEAKTIRDKYVHPPETTEYAILFLPTEGLFAEALRLPGFMEYAQNQCQVMVAGPTNLAALLNSIRLGFRTLAIQEKSGEIKKLLGIIKTDMGKFSDIVEKAQKKLGEADKTLSEAADRTRIITKKLRHVEELPEAEREKLLPGGADGNDGIDGIDGIESE